MIFIKPKLCVKNLIFEEKNSFIRAQVHHTKTMGKVNKAKVADDDQQVSFEATDHGDSVLAGLKYLREKQQLFDVTFIVEGQKFQAHRVVLASCSDYFRYESIGLIFSSRLTKKNCPTD